jgi:replication factor C subunit 1
MVHGSQQQWSLLPVHGMFSSVRPAYWCHGVGGFGGGGGGGFGGNSAQNTSAFPACVRMWSVEIRTLRVASIRWFGKNSTQSKLQRLLGDIQIRMRLRVSGDRKEIRQAYLPTLFPKLTTHLVDDGADGIEPTIEVMDYYYLTKDEFDAILELGIGDQNGEAVMKSIPSQVKAAFTKACARVSDDGRT